MHVWICEENEYLVGELIRKVMVEFEKRYNEEGQHEEVQIINDINFEFIQLMDQQSEVLIGKSKEWELLRGVYNDKLNKILPKLEYKKMIEKLWIFCYDYIRKNIWQQRCEEVADLENFREINKRDLRKRKREVRKLEDESNEI
jgi:hypothetical protein